MISAHTRGEIVEKGNVLTLEPSVGELRQGDTFADRSQATLMLHELSPLLMTPLFDNVTNLVQKHFEVSFIKEFDMNGLLTFSKLEAEKTRIILVGGRYDLLHAHQQEALDRICVFIIIFDRED